MPDALIQAAPWIALACCITAIVLIIWGVRAAWRAWTRLGTVQDAATSLIEVHMNQLDEGMLLTSERLGTVAEHGEVLSGHVADLRKDVSYLQWLLGRIPTERERFKRAIIDLLLPTKEHSDARD